MIVATVLIVAAVAATVLVGLRALVTGESPTDTDVEENWLIVHAPGWLAGPLRTLDRRFIGGAAVGAAFMVIFAATLVVGWIFGGLDDARGFARWDAAAAEFGRDRATDGSTRFLNAVTDLGGTYSLVGAILLVGIYQSVRHSDHGPLWYLGSVGIGVTLLNNGLKLVVGRDRPDIAQLAGYAGSSFPSGHSAAAAACWAAIALVLVRRRSFPLRWAAGFLAVFISCSVAATRVLLGVHWLTDVIAGVVVGWAWFLLVTIAFGGQRLRLGDVAGRPATDRPASDRPASDGPAQDHRTTVSIGDERRQR